MITYKHYFYRQLLGSQHNIFTCILLIIETNYFWEWGVRIFSLLSLYFFLNAHPEKPILNVLYFICTLPEIVHFHILLIQLVCNQLCVWLHRSFLWSFEFFQPLRSQCMALHLHPHSWFLALWNQLVGAQVCILSM